MRLLILLSAISLCAACTGKSSDEPPSKKSPVSVTAVSPLPPPTPGNIDISITGAITRSIRGDGVHCIDWNSASFEFYILSSDVEGFDRSSEWILNCGRFGNKDQQPIFVRFLTDRREYEWQRSFVWQQNEDDTGGFRKNKDEVLLDIALSSEETGENIRIKGRILCPDVVLENRVPLPIINLLERVTGTPVRRFSTFDFGRGQEHRAISVVVPQDTIQETVGTMRARLPAGWIVFAGTSNWLGDERPPGVELVVAPGANQFDILRIARSDAANFDMGTESIVKKLKQYDAQVGIDIFHAETDTVEFSIKRIPADMQKFAEDIYRFCPDSVDQGTGSLDALIKTIKETKQVFLWWD